MEDIGFLGNIDIPPDGEKEQRAVLRAMITIEEGFEVVFSLSIPDKEVYRQLYLPQLDRTFHAWFSGFSPDRTKFYRVHINNVSLSDYLYKLKYEFIDGGWFLESSNVPEKE